MRTLDDARRDLRAALDAGDLRRARRALHGFPALRGPEAALLWAELLWADPELPNRAAVAETLLDAFPEHGEIVRPCGEVLLDTLPGVIAGDPPVGEREAKRVSDAVDACLAARPEYGPEARLLLRRTRASALSRLPSAPPRQVEEAWAEILTHHPEDGAGWFELTLWLKYRGRFVEGLGTALQAQARLGDHPSVLWNVGICATGAGDAERAVEAWRALEMPAIVDGLARVEGLRERRVRLVTTDPVYGDPQADRAEYVALLEPIGPCDGRLLEPAGPFPSGARVLHDATPLSQDPVVLPALAILA